MDLEKAYDSVPRNGLFQVLEAEGVPETVIQILKSIYKNPLAQVRIGKTLGRQFQIRTGVRQGCVLSCILFNIVLNQVVRSVEPVLNVNGARLSLKGGDLWVHPDPLQVRETTFWGLMYADDIVFTAASQEGLQNIVNAFCQALSRAGMRINLKKTVVMHCGKAPLKINVAIGSHELEQVKEFKYVGTIVTERAQMDTELESRMNLASRIFGSLCHRVFRNPDIERRDQVRIYETKVLSTMLYNAEVWALQKKQMQKLEVFHLRNIRYICGKTRLDKIRNTELLKMAGTESIEEKILRKRMNWAYKLERQPAERLSRGMVHASLSEKRPCGAPPLRWSAQTLKILEFLKLKPFLQQREGTWRKQLRGVKNKLRPEQGKGTKRWKRDRILYSFSKRVTNVVANSAQQEA